MVRVTGDLELIQGQGDKGVWRSCTESTDNTEVKITAVRWQSYTPHHCVPLVIIHMHLRLFLVPYLSRHPVDQSCNV